MEWYVLPDNSIILKDKFMSDFEQAKAATTGEDQTTAEAPKTPEPPPSRTVWINRFTMTAPLVVADQVRPGLESNLLFGSYRGNPRLQVMTNDPADAENNRGVITAPMDPVTFEVLHGYVLELTDPAFNQPGRVIRPVKNFNQYKGRERFDEPQHINTTILTREEDGRISIKIFEEGRPTPTFFFGPPKYHQLLQQDRTPVPAGEASRRYARGHFAALAATLSSMAAIEVMQPKPQQAPKVNIGGGQQGGGNGYQRPNGGSGQWGNRNGGYQQRQGGFQRQGGGGQWGGNRGGGFQRPNNGNGQWGGNRGGNGGQQGGNSYQQRQNPPAEASIANSDIPF